MSKRVNTQIARTVRNSTSKTYLLRVLDLVRSGHDAAQEVQVTLEKGSAGWNHLFINGYHDPAVCPECLKPGSLGATAALSPQPQLKQAESTDALPNSESTKELEAYITEQKIAELERLCIPKRAIGPNGEDMGINTPDHDAIWRRITERLEDLKQGYDQ